MAIYAPDGSWNGTESDHPNGRGLHSPDGKLRMIRATVEVGFYDPTGGIYIEVTDGTGLRGFYNDRGNLRVVRAEAVGTKGLYAANGAIRVTGLTP